MIEKLSLPIKKSQLSRLLNKLGYSYKKTLHPKEQLRDDVVKQRADFLENQQSLDQKHLVFLDESTLVST